MAARFSKPLLPTVKYEKFQVLSFQPVAQNMAEWEAQKQAEHEERERQHKEGERRKQIVDAYEAECRREFLHRIGQLQSYYYDHLRSLDEHAKANLLQLRKENAPLVMTFKNNCRRWMVIQREHLKPEFMSYLKADKAYLDAKGLYKVAMLVVQDPEGENDFLQAQLEKAFEDREQIRQRQIAKATKETFALLGMNHNTFSLDNVDEALQDAAGNPNAAGMGLPGPGL